MRTAVPQRSVLWESAAANGGPASREGSLHSLEFYAALRNISVKF